MVRARTNPKPWEKWLWWKIRKARKICRQAERRLDLESASAVYDDEGNTNSTVDQLLQIASKHEEELNLLLQNRLIASARRWRIYVPSRSDKHVWVNHYTGMSFLNTQAAHSIREQRRNRWLAIVGLVFGASSIIQAVCAVISVMRLG